MVSSLNGGAELIIGERAKPEMRIPGLENERLLILKIQRWKGLLTAPSVFQLSAFRLTREEGGEAHTPSFHRPGRTGAVRGPRPVASHLDGAACQLDGVLWTRFLFLTQAPLV